MGLLSPTLNAKVVNLFLAQMSQELPADVHAVMVWDGAGYHTARELKIPPNITILKLPPYSPELNPIENLWHYLRSHHWSNRFYKDYDALFDAAGEAWRKVCLNESRIRTVYLRHTSRYKNAENKEKAYKWTDQYATLSRCDSRNRTHSSPQPQWLERQCDEDEKCV